MSRHVEVYPGGPEGKPCPYGEPFAPLPTSWILCAPTGGGKTMTLLSLVLKYYKDMFDRIWVVSPSINLDPQYKVLRDRLEKFSDQKKEPLYFEDWEHEKIASILNTQRDIVESCRKRGVKAPHVLLILDDMGDYTDIMQARKGAKIGGSWMTTLATKGRYFQVSWLVTCQKFNQIGRVIRSNVRNLLVWRQRNAKEVESLCEELSGWYSKDTVLQMYEHATSAADYSFLLIRLDVKKAEDAFWLRFEKRLLPTNEDERGVSDGGPVGSKLLEAQPPGSKGAGGAVHPPEEGDARGQAGGRGPAGQDLRPGANARPGDPKAKARRRAAT